MQTQVIGAPRWWQWPTILSLDAPLVALLWQWEIARAVGVSLVEPRPFVLGASVWLAYAADRWIEGWRLHPDRVRTQRHLFYQRARWSVAIMWAVVFALDVALAVDGLSDRELEGGLVLLGAVLMYLFSHQVIHRNHPWRAPKEGCVALLLAGGACLFLATRADVPLGRLVIPVVTFAGLCFANCALISVWENAVDQSHGQTSLARQFSWGRSFSQGTPYVLAVGAGLWWLCAYAPERQAAGCAFVSAGLLMLVDRLRPRIGWEMSRILADVALMSPLIPWIYAHGA